MSRYAPVVLSLLTVLLIAVAPAWSQEAQPKPKKKAVNPAFAKVEDVSRSLATEPPATEVLP